MQNSNLIPGLGRSPGGGSPPVFLPRKYHGQNSLTGCNPWGLKESALTEQLSTVSSTDEGIPPHDSYKGGDISRTMYNMVPYAPNTVGGSQTGSFWPQGNPC